MEKGKFKNDIPITIDHSEITVKNNSQTKEDFKLAHQIKLKSWCSSVRSVNVTPDDQYLIITNCKNSRIRVFDLTKLEYLPHKYNGHTATVRLTSTSHDSCAFFTSSWDKSHRLFNIITGKCTLLLYSQNQNRSPSCFYDSKNKLLFTGEYSDFEINPGNKGVCWDLSIRKPVNTYKHFNERLNPECIDIAWDQEFVYTASDDGCAFKWHLYGKNPIFKFFEFDGTVRKIAISKNYFIAACTDSIVRVHNKFSGGYVNYFIHDKEVKDVCISKDETKIYSAADDGTVHCHDLMSKKLIFKSKVGSTWIWSMCLYNKDKNIVIGSIDGRITFLSAETGQILAYLYNLPYENDVIMTSPSDKAFPNGFFYTTSKDIVEVFSVDEKSIIQGKLELYNSRRIAYLNKLNLKNLMLTRIKNKRQYESLTNNFLKNQKLIASINHFHDSPKALQTKI
ncbi:hypothetical protein N9164_09845 [Draconibacterium sp.]|nr:hypothetical protein [Draconibacterium sp.]